MTCIVGIPDGTNVWLGGDSAGVAGYSLVVRADQKVFRSGEFVMGFTDSFRMGQLLRFSLKPPACEEGSDLFAYMCGPFVDAVRDCLKAGGYARRRDETEEGGNFLVGYRGRLFEVCSDYQVGETASGFNAVGCGAAVALGALEAQRMLAPETSQRPDSRLCPELSLLRALHAAEAWNTGVRGPFHVVSTASTATTPTGPSAPKGRCRP
jgi:hypothetical protein